MHTKCAGEGYAFNSALHTPNSTLLKNMPYFTEEKQKPYKAERKSNLTAVSSVMDAIKKEIGLDEDFFTVLKVWKQETGIEDSAICGYKNGTILAQTDSSAAINDIMIRKKEIINKLNQYIGAKKIKNIKIGIKG